VPEQRNESRLPLREVEVGQVWRELSQYGRGRNRHVRIEGISEGGDFAYVESIIAGRIGRRSRIHVSRFDGRQYELAREALGA
jgi:hypothetical protein